MGQAGRNATVFRAAPGWLTDSRPSCRTWRNDQGRTDGLCRRRRRLCARRAAGRRGPWSRRCATRCATAAPTTRARGTRPSGRVALGHRRLSIVDLSPAGHQPMANEDGTVWITFNGEIYNHAALRAELEAQGHVYRSRTDTETIVHLYEEEGRACVERLDGHVRVRDLGRAPPRAVPRPRPARASSRSTTRSRPAASSSARRSRRCSSTPASPRGPRRGGVRTTT